MVGLGSLALKAKKTKGNKGHFYLMLKWKSQTLPPSRENASINFPHCSRLCCLVMSEPKHPGRAELSYPKMFAESPVSRTKGMGSRIREKDC